MDEAVKKELKKMFSLMERMDSHCTLTEALETEERIEHKRDTFTDLDVFLKNVELGKSFVGLGYIQGYEAKKIYPTNTGSSQASDIKAALSKADKNSRIYGKLNGLVNDPEFTNPTGRAFGGFRSMANSPFAGVIKITNYVFNWGDAASYSDFAKKHFGDRDNLINNVLKKASWSTNPIYKGIEPTDPNSTEGRAGYHQQLDPKNSLYGFSDAQKINGQWQYNPIYTTLPDGSQIQKRAIKTGLKNVKKQWSKFCLVDNNGEIDSVDKIVGPSLGKLPNEFKDLRKYIDFGTMKADEIDFINTFSRLEQNYADSNKVWLTDHILYIVAKDRSTGNFVRYINPDVSIDKFNVNSGELKAIVDGELKDTESVVRYSSKPAAE